MSVVGVVGLAAAEPTAGIKTILVPTDGSRASMQAVALACSIAKKNKGKVYVVHVIEVKRALPLDAELEPETGEGERILVEAEKVAEGLDFEVEGELLQAREAGHAVVDEAIERGVDGIIVGVEYKRAFGEFQPGRLIQYVLRNAPCLVWVCRQPVEERE
jgi:nucleotide-binding universal stress UspA family protein